MRRHELSTEQGCVLWGMRVIIPPMYRNRLILMLHAEHPGIVAMKAICRSYVWWPNIDAEIELVVRECDVCQSVRPAPPAAPLHPWKWPSRVWQRIHIDFAEKDSENYLVLIDSHSKWIEVKHMRSTTAQKTIDVLRTIFAAYGIPEECVSDNGPQFISEDFAIFMKQNGIKHTLTPPYHPASNGAAERSVQILKRALRKDSKSVRNGRKSYSIDHRLANFLIQYRNTPHSVTGVTPAELFFKRKPRTLLTLIKPSLASSMENNQNRQAEAHDKTKPVKMREFQPYSPVNVKNQHGGPDKWIPGTVIRRLGPLTYLVRVGHNLRYVHMEHLTSSNVRNVPNRQCDTSEIVLPEPISAAPVIELPPVTPVVSDLQPNAKPPTPKRETVTKTESVPEPRHSTRNRKPVVKMNL